MCTVKRPLTLAVSKESIATIYELTRRLNCECEVESCWGYEKREARVKVTFLNDVVNVTTKEELISGLLKTGMFEEDDIEFENEI